jgi:hypothetical protein
VIYHVPGLWEGTYQTDQVSHTPTYTSFTFYPDGSLICKATGVPPAQSVIYTKGSWTLSDNQLTIRDTTIGYTSTVIRTVMFTYDSTKKTLSNGTWQDVIGDDGHYYTGTFPSMEKVTY